MITNEKSIGRQFFSYALPAVIGMVVSALYTVVDGIMVGRGVGAYALAAVNIVFPYIMVQIALSMLIAVGGANLFSIRRGQGEHAVANNIFTQCMSLLVIVAAVVNTLALVFAAPFCTLLGADETTLSQAVSYLRITALFGYVHMPSLGLGMFVRNDGAPQVEMLATVTGALTNIVLDYVFIFPLGWGVAGAAWATGIGQVVVLCTVGMHLLFKRGTLRVVRPRFNKHEVKKLLYNGIPSFFSELSQSTVTLSFNLAISAAMGALGIAAYSIVMYICSIFQMVLVGITQGAQPLISFNHGSGREDNVRKVYRMGVTASLVLTTIFYGVILLWGRGLASLFIMGDTALIGSAYEIMVPYFLGFFPIGLSLMSILRMQATEREVPAIAVSAMRCLGFLQVFLLVLPRLMGTMGIYISLLVGESCNCAFALGTALRGGKRAGARGARSSRRKKKELQRSGN